MNKNLIILGVILMMSLGTWLLPENYSAESVKSRVLIGTFNTNPTRMAIIDQNCKGITRDSLISTDEAATSQGYKNQMAAQFTLNG